MFHLPEYHFSRRLNSEPELFQGIGQISRASREFKSSLEEILDPSLMKKLQITITLLHDKVIHSNSLDKFSAPFIWKSEGMLELGYPSELEFNGLIRCSMENSVITSSHIGFNPFSIIRQSNFNYQ